jgi:quercetin dioxygenase-like cupin family protein
MNIQTFHTEEKPFQTKIIFSASEGKVISIQMEKDAILKEHITKVPAMLICIDGEISFENENHFIQILKRGDYINIEENVKHWLTASTKSNLILIK